MMNWELTIQLLYLAALCPLALMGLHRLILVSAMRNYTRKGRQKGVEAPPPMISPTSPDDLPVVTVQLPLYNERYVAERLVRAVTVMEYPAAKLEVQVLDDSTDDTADILERVCAELCAEGHDVKHLRRPDRAGFKAGALAWGLEQARGGLIAVFDADFVPNPDWLQQVVPHFVSRDELGMVQTRWGWLNRDTSLLTRLQAKFLDAHFGIEHQGRMAMGCFFNFNGTAGIWRRQAIVDAGGWSSDTLTEDLDLSYRSQLAGWKFLYLNDVVVPSELPEEMNAFRSQQARWSQGAIQVLKKLGWRIMRDRRATLHQKAEALAHLGCNFSYILLLTMGALLPLMLILQPQINIAWFAMMSAVVFAAGTLCVAWFYYVAQRADGVGPLEAAAYLPIVMAFGIGMSFNNAWAVTRGLIGSKTPFRRTAKYGAAQAQLKPKAKVAGELSTNGEYSSSSPGTLHWIGKAYVSRKFGAVLGESLLACWTTLALVAALLDGLWLSTPFVALFVLGFGMMVILSLQQMLALFRAKTRHTVLP